jgi:exodeoxyribonuclease VII small subunit
MPEETHTFTTARTRLDEIVTQVRKKDTSLERSLDLLEEGVRLANQCTELIDHADWESLSEDSSRVPEDAPAGSEDTAASIDQGDTRPDTAETN